MAALQQRRPDQQRSKQPSADVQRQQAAVQAATEKKPATTQKKPKEPPPPAEGFYKDLGVTDESGAFGALGSGPRSGDVRGIVEHRTEGSTMDSARNNYRKMIKEGRHVGAHYLIGTAGETSLTVPTDSTTAHVRGNKDKAWSGANAWSVGIENVGTAKPINKKGDVRAQVTAMNLSPGMKARLLAMDDKTLTASLASDGNEVHQDITGPQKRSNWNLVSRLAADHHLDMDKDVVAHEQVDYKSTGEGEPIIEFLGAMRQWPEKVRMLEAKLGVMEKDPKVAPERVQEGRRVLEQARATMTAVQADKTPAENNALEGEKLLGEPGPAAGREQQRTDFYDKFWARTQEIDGLNKP